LGADAPRGQRSQEFTVRDLRQANAERVTAGTPLPIVQREAGQRSPDVTLAISAGITDASMSAAVDSSMRCSLRMRELV